MCFRVCHGTEWFALDSLRVVITGGRRAGYAGVKSYGTEVASLALAQVTVDVEVRLYTSVARGTQMSSCTYK